MISPIHFQKNLIFAFISTDVYRMVILNIETKEYFFPKPQIVSSFFYAKFRSLSDFLYIISDEGDLYKLNLNDFFIQNICKNSDYRFADQIFLSQNNQNLFMTFLYM